MTNLFMLQPRAAGQHRSHRFLSAQPSPSKPNRFHLHRSYLLGDGHSSGCQHPQHSNTQEEVLRSRKRRGISHLRKNAQGSFMRCTPNTTRFLRFSRSERCLHGQNAWPFGLWKKRNFWGYEVPAAQVFIILADSTVSYPKSPPLAWLHSSPAGEV